MLIAKQYYMMSKYSMYQTQSKAKKYQENLFIVTTKMSLKMMQQNSSTLVKNDYIINKFHLFLHQSIYLYKSHIMFKGCLLLQFKFLQMFHHYHLSFTEDMPA